MRLFKRDIFKVKNQGNSFRKLLWFRNISRNFFIRSNCTLSLYHSSFSFRFRLPKTTKSRSDILVQRRGRKLLLKQINTTKFIAKLAWASKQTTNSTEDSKVRKDIIFIQTSFNLTWSTKFMAFLTSKLHSDLIFYCIDSKASTCIGEHSYMTSDVFWEFLTYLLSGAK